MNVIPDPAWIPPEVDTTRPAVARIYDYLLGGAHNFAADRAAAHRVIAAVPDAPAMARANRAFLHRAVRYMTAHGITQFLDLGSGIPTLGNVHDTARVHHPDAVTIYVDIDPVAVSHAHLMLHNDPHADAIHADLRHPHTILTHPTVTRLIDWTRPVGLLAVAVLHFIPDTDDPAGILTHYRHTLPPGSYLALSHLTHDTTSSRQTPAITTAADIYRDTRQPLHFRSRTQLRHLLHSYTLIPPGIVPIPAWHPHPGEHDTALWVPAYAALAYIPTTPDNPQQTPQTATTPNSRPCPPESPGRNTG